MGAVEAATLLALAVSLTVGGPIVDTLGPRAAYGIGGPTTVVAAPIVGTDAAPGPAAAPGRQGL